MNRKVRKQHTAAVVDAKPSERSQETSEGSRKTLETQVKEPTREDWKSYFTPEQIETIKEMTKVFREGFPWLEAEREEVRMVTWRASFPRSISGKRQDDQLTRALSFTKPNGPLTSANLIEVAKVAAEIVLGWREKEIYPKSLEGGFEFEFLRLATRLFKLYNLSEIDYPKSAGAFFQTIAEDLKFLENYKPTASDFAIQALQEAFVGFMRTDYDWGSRGLPTKGKVIEMAKVDLEKTGKSIKYGWTKMLKEAGLDWLPEGVAGRPKKQEVDANLKAKKEFLSKAAQFVNDHKGGDWIAMLERAKSAFGGKELYLQEEQDRLKEANDFSYEESEAD
jgi:hypothetical protein